MRVALCQTEIAYEKKEVNFIKAGRMIESAVAQGAELVLLPEMSFTGYSMNTGVTKEKAEDSPTIHLMQGYAQNYRTAIGFGWVSAPENEEEADANAMMGTAALDAAKCQNHYTVIGADGTILADYVKIHPFSPKGEDIAFRGGTKIERFELGGITFGLSVCYDLRFPELYSELTRKAEVVIVAANWPKARAEHWKILMKARALETQSYFLGVNCVGTQGTDEYEGDSMVVNPDGHVMIEKANEEIILIADIPATVLEQRLTFPVRSDRRDDLYTRWYWEHS